MGRAEPPRAATPSLRSLKTHDSRCWISGKLVPSLAAPPAPPCGPAAAFPALMAARRTKCAALVLSARAARDEEHLGEPQQQLQQRHGRCDREDRDSLREHVRALVRRAGRALEREGAWAQPSQSSGAVGSASRSGPSGTPHLARAEEFLALQQHGA